MFISVNVLPYHPIIIIMIGRSYQDSTSALFLCIFQKNTCYPHNKIIIKLIHNFNLHGKVPGTQNTENKREL